MFDDWFNDQTKSVQADCAETLRFLAAQERTGWHPPHFKMLHGDKTHPIGEVRLKRGKSPFRPLGRFEPHRRDAVFTFLLEASKTETSSGKTSWNPKEALSTAIRRYTEIEGNPDSYQRCEVFEDEDEIQKTLAEDQ